MQLWVLRIRRLTYAALVLAGLFPASGLAETFSSTTPGPGTFTEPANANRMTIMAYGAGGGKGGSACTPGKGGHVHATFDVAPGSVLKFTVGGKGAAASGELGGAGGIGGGGGGGSAYSEGGGGGGGATTVTRSDGSALVVAAGGGGCGAFTIGTAGVMGNGGNDGAAGFDGDLATGGGAGSLTAGGAGGRSSQATDPNGGDGISGQGGLGAGTAWQDGGGGGGGGGYFGGGGGGGVEYYDGTAGGGGGGSDFVALGPVSATITTGSRSADGSLTFSYTPAKAPGAITWSASDVAVTTATLNGRVDPNGLQTTYQFEYGTTIAYGSTTSPGSVGSGTSSIGVSQAITGLSPGTTYHFRAVAQSASGTSYGSDVAFTTAGPPLVSTGPATVVGATNATVTGTVDAQALLTTFHFEYGTSVAYGASTTPASAGAGRGAHSYFQVLSGLSPGTTYHFRIVAENSSGTTYGADQTLTTAEVRPVLSKVSQTNKIWRRGNKLVRITRVGPPVGTTFRFTLDSAAVVRLDFTQSLPGRKVAANCVIANRRNQRRPKCSRTVVRGTLTFTAHAGINAVYFQGRISRTKKLTPGRYTLVLTATKPNVIGSASRRLTFTIVR